MIDCFIFKLGCSNGEKSVKMRRKQQTYMCTHVMKNTWNQALSRVESKATTGKPYWHARHDVTGSDLHYLPPYYILAVPYLKLPIRASRVSVFRCVRNALSDSFPEKVSTNSRHQPCSGCHAGFLYLSNLPSSSSLRRVLAPILKCPNR